ncbi:arrestin domain-containing protein 3-like isoform X1 [Limulus polyphemus]|uniref:Arrestin domain-containing protein 3-like isoform X1 n=1 Tax=Limulus polyphemus TaxID=6850 RepID=A0ABM1BDP0_LIMPO|nr:arrestin domain-containing protein 3-like isoform X1 [Limulus polyphemus]
MGKLKAFEIIFDGNKAVFYPGQEVSGKCVVDLRGDMKMKSLRVFMRGVAKVHWTESRSTGNRLGAYTEHYNAEIEYFFKKQVLFGGDTGEGREVLAEGHHEFPFSFQLPSGGISTSFEGKYGSIRYWLKAEVEKPWTFNHKTKKAFTVISPIDINRTEYMMAVENSIEKTLCCWCCTSGPISLYAHTDRKGYCPGESIAITADFENLSSRTIIPHATLHQTQTFIAGGKSRSRISKFTIVTGPAIQPGRTANWDAQLLKIPAVSPSIINSCLIRVDYAVRLTLQIPGAYNLSVDLPVVIGTVPLRTRPSNYRALSSNVEDLSRLNESRLEFYPPAPPYSELDLSSLPDEPPPTYAECVEGSVDITDDDDDGDIIGDTRFTPMYAYVHDYQYQPPPAYSEVDPHPAPGGGQG